LESLPIASLTGTVAESAPQPLGLVRSSKGKVGKANLRLGGAKMSAGSGASHGTMPPGWFVIESALDPNLVLDVPFAIKDAETKVWIHEKNGSDAQTWRQDEGGRLECKACPSLALDISGGNTAERTPVQTFSKNDTPAQKWTYTEAGEFESALNGMVLDVVEGVAKSQTNCHMFPKNGTAAQRWKLVPVHDAGAAKAAGANIYVPGAAKEELPLPPDDVPKKKGLLGKLFG